MPRSLADGTTIATLITDLAESGAGDQTIMDIAGHVSKRMLRHYSYIPMEAKRAALESIVGKANDTAGQESAEIHSRKSVGYPQNSRGY